MATLYVETSIVSYLRQQPSAHVLTAARQLLTHQWWQDERHRYQLVTSQFVIDEASEGNPELAELRLAALEGIPLVDIDSESVTLARALVEQAVLPPAATVDAFHIALAARHGVEYLLTWNCKHIANAKLLPRLQAVLQAWQSHVPIICTPEALVQNDD